MLIGIAAIVIAIFFAGGQETFFLTPKLKKQVKTYVIEKDRQKEIFVIMKESKKKQKAFTKTRKSYMKKYHQLNLDRNSTVEDHKELFVAYYDERKEIVDYSIEQEMAMKKITTEEEWGDIMNVVLAQTTKEKARDKMQKTMDKAFGNVIQSCNDHISNPDNRNSAVSSVTRLQGKVDELIPRLADLGYKNMETIRDYSAAKSAYERISNDHHQMRKEIDDLFLDFRFELLDMTTVDEWNVLMKDISKLLKKDMVS
jgi:hypothetical protein